VRVIVCGALLVGGVAALPAAQVSRENIVKAASLPQFALFVEWPDAAFEGRDAFGLCLSADHPFGDAVREVTADTRLRDLPVAVRIVDRATELDECHLLFVAHARRNRGLLDGASTRPILTVGNEADFLDRGGILDLRMVHGQLRFDVNLEAARAANLRLPSQLLGLADHVRGGRR
jgi:hypothetical protein